MELVATAKLKKLGNRILAARPYSQELFGLLQDLLASGLTLPLAAQRPVRKVLAIAIASNRGLCGAYNVRIVDRLRQRLEEWKQKQQDVELWVMGKRALGMLQFSGIKVDRPFFDLDDRTPFERIQGLAQEVMALFLQEKVDQVWILYTAFRSRAFQSLEEQILLPVMPSEKRGEASLPYLFEPSAQEVLKNLGPLAVEMSFYQMFLEAITSEQAYRMRAMKNATENATEMIKQLTRQYNRQRQTQITMELLDIIGGAQAL